MDEWMTVTQYMWTYQVPHSRLQSLRLKCAAEAKMLMAAQSLEPRKIVGGSHRNRREINTYPLEVLKIAWLKARGIRVP